MVGAGQSEQEGDRPSGVGPSPAVCQLGKDFSVSSDPRWKKNQ